MTLLLVALAVVAAYRFRHRITCRVRAFLLVVAVLGLNLALGAPAVAQGGCGEAPTPERPGTGMVGALDEPVGQGEPDSAYFRYGYAGMVWHVYDTDCDLVSDRVGGLDNWAGNQVFDVAKLLVGATNSLHYELLNGSVLGGLNEQIRAVGDHVFRNIFAQLAGLFLLLLAVRLLWLALRGDLAEASRRTLFSFMGMWLAASSVALVAFYGHIDDVIVDFTVGVQAGFVDPSDDRIIRDTLPTELHTTVVYENWLRGEFGNQTSQNADTFGRALLDAQAWTIDQIHQRKDIDAAIEKSKKDQYVTIAGQLGSSTDTFTGRAGTRVGTGFLALFQALTYTLFPLLAKIGLITAQVLLRLLTMTGPIIGLIAIINPGILRRIGNTAGAVVAIVFLLGILSAVHTKLLQIIDDDQNQLALFVQILLAALITAIFLMPGILILRHHRKRTKHKRHNQAEKEFEDENEASTPKQRKGKAGKNRAGNGQCSNQRPEANDPTATQDHGSLQEIHTALPPGSVMLVTSATKGIDVATEDIDKYRKKHRVGKRKTVAVTEYELNGNLGGYIGTSGHHQYAGAVPMPQNPMFDPGDRDADAEWKILEHIAESLDPSATGRIHLTIEQAPCDACEEVIEQFMVAFPGIRVSYVDLGRDNKNLRDRDRS